MTQLKDNGLSLLRRYREDQQEIAQNWLQLYEAHPNQYVTIEDGQFIIAPTIEELQAKVSDLPNRPCQYLSQFTLHQEVSL